MITAIISLIGTIISGVLATIVTLYINHKQELLREKRSLVADVFGYRFLINKGDERAEKFYAALNRIRIVFDENKDVVQALEELYAGAMIKDPAERTKKMNDSLVTLLKNLCKAIGVKCDNWNDSKVLNVFGV